MTVLPSHPTTPSQLPLGFRHMSRHTSWLFKRIFARHIGRIHVSAEEKALVTHDLAAHQVVYILKQPSLLEFNFFNALFLKEGLPLAQWAPQIMAWLLFWRPWQERLRGIMAWLREWIDGYGKDTRTRFEDKLDTALRIGEPILLCLTPNYRFRLRRRSSSELLASLASVANRRGVTLAFLPLHFIYDYRAYKPGSKWVQFLSDYRFPHGILHKFLSFVWGAQRLGKLEFDTPLIFSGGHWISEISTVPNPSAPVNGHGIERQLSQAFEEERLRLAGPNLLTPRDIYRDLLLDRGFQSGLAYFAGQEHHSVESILKKTERYFFELAADMNPAFIDAYDLLLRRVFRTLYTGISIEEAGLEKIKALSGDAAIVLVPNHRSHADYLLLSYVFYEHHMTPPHICGGINLKFWPLGYFLRHGGCFFIHRHLDSHSLYAFVLKAYLNVLITRGYTIEFFIEGTRSRTGKLLRAKLGFLRFIVEAFLQIPEKPIYFVPVSFTYDKIFEEHSYADERAGKRKKKESMRDIVHLKRLLRSRYGQVHIGFADPISLQDFWKDAPAGPEPIPHHHLATLAAKIEHGINQHLVVTASSLVAMAVLRRESIALSQAQITDWVRPYLDYLSYRNRPLSPALRANPEVAIAEALTLLTDSRALACFVDGNDTWYRIEKEKRSALDYYKNNGLHFFVSLACVCTLILSAPAQTLFLSALAAQFERLKVLFTFEFATSGRLSAHQHAEEILEYLVCRGFLIKEVHRVRLATPEHAHALAHFAVLLTPFFEAYWLALSAMTELSFSRMPRATLIRTMIELGKLKHYRGQLHFPEALNHWVLENALDRFHENGFVRRHDEDGKKGRDLYSKLPAGAAIEEERQWLARFI